MGDYYNEVSEFKANSLLLVKIYKAIENGNPIEAFYENQILDIENGLIDNEEEVGKILRAIAHRMKIQ